jgi:hypothetical protein
MIDGGNLMTPLRGWPTRRSLNGRYAAYRVLIAAFTIATMPARTA